MTNHVDGAPSSTWATEIRGEKQDEKAELRGYVGLLLWR